MSKQKPGTKEVAKSAVDGKFVSKDYAKKHPSTTIVQKVKK